MTLKDILIAGKLTISEGGGGGGVVTIRLGLSYDLDNGWSGEFLDGDLNPLDYADVLALTNNGADVALVQYGGATSPMSYYPEDEEFSAYVYAYNPNLYFWELISIDLSSNGYNFYTNDSYAKVAVGVPIVKVSDEYHSSLGYNAIAAILNNGGYVYAIARPNGVEDCIYALDKYAYITGSSGYVTFKRIAYNTYNNVSTMGIEYFTINSSGVSRRTESYTLQPST